MYDLKAYITCTIVYPKKLYKLTCSCKSTEKNRYIIDHIGLKDFFTQAYIYVNCFSYMLIILTNQSG